MLVQLAVERIYSLHDWFPCQARVNGQVSCQSLVAGARIEPVKADRRNYVDYVDIK